MVPKCLFMQPGSIGRTRSNHTTYIQNNFYGGGRPQNIWTYRPPCPPPVYCVPSYSFGIPSFLPPYAQNAVTRFVGFNLLNGIFNFTKQATTTPPATIPDSSVTTSELDEVNNRYT